MSKHRKHTGVASIMIAMAMLALPAMGATIWNGNGDSNNDGNWNTNGNWDTGTQPSGESATLGDVTGNGNSGDATRTVTLNTSESISQLIMTQSTGGYTNLLDMTGGTLTVSSSTPISQTLSGGSLQIDMSGSAHIRNSSGNSWTNDGTLNLAGSNVRIGATGRSRNTTITNAGSMDVGGTFATLGHQDTSTSSWPNGDIALNNEASASITVADGASLRLRSLSRFKGMGQGNVYNKENSTFQIGTEGGAGGSVRFWHYHNTAMNDDDYTSTQRFRNAGTLDVLGNSTLELYEEWHGWHSSYPHAGTTQIFTVDNESTGTINLNGTSTIGRLGAGTDGDKYLVTQFTNAGTFNKTGTGTASILSRESVTHFHGTFSYGSNTNTGTLNVQDASGTLRFSQPLDSSGALIGNGTFAVDNGNITIQDGGTVNAGQTPGDIATLGLEAATVVFEDNSTLEIDVGSSDLIEITGDLELDEGSIVEFTDTPASYGFSFLTYTGTLSGEFGSVLGLPDNMSVDYGTAGILTVIPEPASLALLALGSAVMVNMRRRRA